MDRPIELHDERPQGFRAADDSRVVHYKFDVIADKWPVMKAVLGKSSYTFWVPLPINDQGQGRGDNKVFIPGKETGIMTSIWTKTRYMRYLQSSYEFFDVSPQGSWPHIVGYKKIQPRSTAGQATSVTASVIPSPVSSVRGAKSSPAASVKRGRGR